MRLFKYVFHKVAACVNCGECEANCRYGAISFENGLHIDEKKCTHCKDCHSINLGCLLYESTRLAKNGDMNLKGLNTFSDHAPKPEWIKGFFDNPEVFLKENQLGSVQIVKFKRFLFDSELVDRKNKAVTEFTALIKKIGSNTATAWALILVNLVYNNLQIRWYIENLPVNEGFDRKVIEEKLRSAEVSEGNTRSIVKAFKRLCEIPLGTELNFGTTTSDGKNLATLKRTKAKINDARVILYSLYKFAEATDGWYQFNLTRLMSNTDSAEQKFLESIVKKCSSF